MKNTGRGRNLKKGKLNTTTNAFAGVIQFPSRDFWCEALLKRNFDTVEQVAVFKRAIRKEMIELTASMGADCMEPIIVISNLYQEALNKTKNNTLKLDVTFFTNNIINTIEEINEELIVKSLEKIKLIKI